jgi:hypothetical protein
MHYKKEKENKSKSYLFGEAHFSQSKNEKVEKKSPK